MPKNPFLDFLAGKSEEEQLVSSPDLPQYDPINGEQAQLDEAKRKAMEQLTAYSPNDRDASYYDKTGESPKFTPDQLEAEAWERAKSAILNQKLREKEAGEREWKLENMRRSEAKLPPMPAPQSSVKPSTAQVPNFSAPQMPEIPGVPPLAAGAPAPTRAPALGDIKPAGSTSTATKTMTRVKGNIPPSEAPVEAPAASPGPMVKADPTEFGYGEDLNDAALQKAQRNKNIIELMANLGKASTTMASGISGAKLDSSFYDGIHKAAGGGIEDIKTRRAAKDQDLKRKKELIDSSTEEEKSRPDSPVSRLAQQMAKELFPNFKSDNLSAASLEKVMKLDSMYNALQNRKLQEQMAEDRKEERAERASERKDRASERDDYKNYEIAGREYDRLHKSKEFEKYQISNDAFVNVQKLAKHAKAFGDLSIMFDYMKALDPGSVVREGEQITFRTTGGVFDRLAAKIGSVTEGTMLTDNQRQELIKVMKMRVDTAKQSYDKIRRPVLQRIESKNIHQSKVDPAFDFEAPSEGKTAPAAPAAHKQDKEAIEWAKANPSDPVAKEILKENGL